ncbi:MAG: hypothetical protein QM477_07000 [Planctomycetota bacterium]
MPSILLGALLVLGSTASLSAQTFDDFETYTISANAAELIGVNSLDDTTVTATGQGPALVMDGCTYSSNGVNLQWCGSGYFGLPGKTLLGNGNVLTLTYDIPVTLITFNLHAFDGFGDSITVNLFDVGGGLISSTSGINVPDSTPVPFSYSGAAVKTVQISSAVYSWSAVLDDHFYSDVAPLDLTITGTCPGPMQLSLTGATPLGSVAIAYGSPGTFTIPAGSCIGTVLDLNAPTLAGFFTADAAGSLSLGFSLPSTFCGLSVQVVDLTTCITSTVAVL